MIREGNLKTAGVLEYKNYTVTFDEMLGMLCVSNSATATQNSKQIKKEGKTLILIYTVLSLRRLLEVIGIGENLN